LRRLIIKYLLYFISLVLIQVLVLNNIQLSSYLNPYIYIFLIIILPFETPGWLLLSVGFVLGMTMDVFPQGWAGQGATLGIHTFATVFAAFTRPIILKWINPRDEYEPGTVPGASDYGFRWYFTYILIIISIHHLVLFSVESMSISHLPQVLGRTLLSVLFSLAIILIWEGFRYNRR
jgi:hypothetical protein